MRLRFAAASLVVLASGAAAQEAYPPAVRGPIDRWAGCVTGQMRAAPPAGDAAAAVGQAMQGCAAQRRAMDEAVALHMRAPRIVIGEIVEDVTRRAHAIARARPRAAAAAPAAGAQTRGAEPARTPRCNIVPRPSPWPADCPQWQPLGRAGDGSELFLDRASITHDSPNGFTVRIRTILAAEQAGIRSVVVTERVDCRGPGAASLHYSAFRTDGTLVRDYVPPGQPGWSVVTSSSPIFPLMQAQCRSIRAPAGG